MTKEEINRTKSFHFGNKEIKELEEKEDEGFLMEISKFYTKNTESPKEEKIEEQRISKKKNQPEGNTVKYDIDIHKVKFNFSFVYF